MKELFGSGDANQSYVRVPMTPGQVIEMLEKEVEIVTAKSHDWAAECERLRDILRDVYCSGFEEGNAVDTYHTVQIDKRTWNDVKREFEI